MAQFSGKLSLRITILITSVGVCVCDATGASSVRVRSAATERQHRAARPILVVTADVRSTAKERIGAEGESNSEISQVS